jgi:uncharacterized protein
MPHHWDFDSVIFSVPRCLCGSRGLAVICYTGCPVAAFRQSPVRKRRATALCHAGLAWTAGLLWLLAPALARAEKLEQLKPQGYVNDFAGVLSEDTRSKLTALCTEVDQKTHAQIAVVTIHTLEGGAIEDFANRLYVRWGIGPKSDNRGVLILLAVDDHRYRVEVGYGLEPILPDGKVGGFGREIVPALRRSDYNGALLQLTNSVAAVIAQASGVTLSQGLPPPTSGESNESNHGLGLGFLLLIALGFLLFGGLRFLFLSRGFGSRRGYYGGRWGGPWIGGGWPGGGFGGFGGGGGGGGGFGGFGGGMSGGGGASGSW